MVDGGRVQRKNPNQAERASYLAYRRTGRQAHKKRGRGGESNPPQPKREVGKSAGRRMSSRSGFCFFLRCTLTGMLMHMATEEGNGNGKRKKGKGCSNRNGKQLVVVLIYIIRNDMAFLRNSARFQDMRFQNKHR